MPPLMIRAGYVMVVAVLLAMTLHNGGAGATVEAGLRVGPAALVLALTATIGSMLISGVIWTRALRCMGCSASPLLGLSVYAASGLAAYAGAGAGSAGQCVLSLRRHGVTPGRAMLLLAIASLIGFCGAVLWTPLGVALLQSPGAAHALPALGTRGPILLIMATGVCGLGSFASLIFLARAPGFAARVRLARLIADPSGPPVPLPLSRLLALIPLAGLAWAAGAGPIWLLVRAVAPHSTLTIPEAIGVQSVATVAASVLFFMPNGLGVRDGAIVSLLVAVAGVPLPAAAAVAVLVRAGDPIGKGLILLLVAVARRLPVPAAPPARPVMRRASVGAS